MDRIGTAPAFGYGISNPRRKRMNNPSGTKRKRNDKLPQEILDLVVAVNKLPQQHRHALDPVLQKVIEGT